jgi:hypothetical protein
MVEKNKMNMKKLVIIVLIILGGWNQLHAQQTREFRGNLSDADRQKLESAKIAFITNRLDLTAEQAKGFWPIYNEYEKKKFDTRTRLMREGYRMSNRGQDELNEAQYQELIALHISSRQTDLENEKAYIEKLKEVINSRQILRLLTIDESFLRNYLMREVQGVNADDRERGPGDRRRIDN